MTNFSNINIGFCFEGEKNQQEYCGYYEWNPILRNTLLFISTVLLIGALIKGFLERIFFLYILIMLLVGVFYGIIFLYVFGSPKEIYNLWSKFISDYFFMPIIIYNLAVSINLHMFLQSLFPYAFLSFIGFGVTFGIITIFVEYYFIDIKKGWFTSTWMGIALTMLSSKTLIKDLRIHGAADNLISVISAESLLSIVLSLIAYKLRLKIEYEVMNVFKIFQIILGHIFSPLLGCIIGITNIYFLRFVIQDKLQSAFLLICCIFGSSILTDFLPGFSNSLCIASFASYINLNKASIDQALQEDIRGLLDALNFMMETLLLSYIGFTIALIFKNNFISIVLSEICFIYLILIFIRFIIILVSSPILMKCGYGLNWQNCAILICGPIRDEKCLSLIFGLFIEQKILNDSHYSYNGALNNFDKPLVIMVILVLLTHLINGLSIRYLRRCLGMITTTKEKKSFMTCLIQQLSDFTLQSINKLKENLLFTSADWKWITKETLASNIYEKVFTKKTNQIEDTTEIQCILCKQELHKAKEEFMLEEESNSTVNQSYKKAIHIAETSHWQRFEKGLIGKIAVNFLTSFCQTTLDRTGQYLDVKLLKEKVDIHDLYFKSIEYLNILMKKIFGKTKSQDQEKIRYLKISKPYFSKSIYNDLLQRFAAKIISSRCFKIVPFLSTIGNLCLFSLLNTWKTYNFIFFFFHIIFIHIFMWEICMKILGYGFKRFWKNFWNKFDFIFVIFTIIQFLILFCETVLLNYSIPKIGFIPFLYIYLGRILCIFRLLIILQGKITNYIQEIINSYWYSTFDIAQGFFWGQDDVKRNLYYIIKNKEIFNDIKNKCILNKQEILKKMAIIHQQFPEPVIAVKTLIASRKILNDAKKTLQEMKNVMITDPDFTVLQTNFDILVHRLNKIPESIPLIIRHVKVMKCVEWMNSSIYKSLQEHIEFKNFESDEIICEINQTCIGIYIIISGLVKIVGTPVNIKSSILPNTDSYLYFFEREKFFDFVSTAQCLGLLGILTQTPLCTSAICETKVETIFISSKNMLEIMKTFKKIPSILYQIWKNISFHIAVPILKQQCHYLECSEENIKILTNESIIPNLEDIVEYERPEGVIDIILIQGIIKNEQTGESFFGPCYIPQSVRRLSFMPKETRQARLITLFYLADYFTLPNEIIWDEGDDKKCYKKLTIIPNFEISKDELSSSKDIKNILNECIAKGQPEYHYTFTEAFIRSPIKDKDIPVNISKLIEAAKKKLNKNTRKETK